MINRSSLARRLSEFSPLTACQGFLYYKNMVNLRQISLFLIILFALRGKVGFASRLVT
jgi:hypothetical protein